jgi:hypothetical protein
MQLSVLQIDGLLNFLMLEAVETLSEFADYSSAVSHALSGLPVDLMGFPTNFDDLADHWHGLTQSSTLSYALLQLPIERMHALLRRDTNMMTAHRHLLALPAI